MASTCFTRIKAISPSWAGWASSTLEPGPTIARLHCATIHNTTEGLGIVAPVAKRRPALWHLAALGALAGLPTIAGAWIGGFTYRPALAVFFLALGAGAIFQVVYQVGQVIRNEAEGGWAAPLNALGLLAGVLIMYSTALLVVA